MRVIGTSAGVGGPILETMLAVADGNPGAMHYLVEIHRQTDSTRMDRLCQSLQTKNLKGSEVYSFIKMHTVSGAIHKFIAAGWL